MSAEERRVLLEGVRQFNEGFFFECHDTLEELWTGLRGPSRNFFQGLIQVSVGFYHLGGGNLAGAKSMFERALARLDGYGEHYYGFDLAAHRREVNEWLDRVRSGSVATPALEHLPKWRFDWAAP